MNVLKLSSIEQRIGRDAPDLLFSGLESISYDLNRRMVDLKFYEFGNVYNYVPAQEASNDVTRKYQERKILSVFVTGSSKAKVGICLWAKQITIS